MADATPVEAFTPLSPAAAGGSRRRHPKRKLKLVTKKQARKILKNLGKKMRGGGADAPVAVPADMTGESASKAPAGGRRTRRRRGYKFF